MTPNELTLSETERERYRQQARGLAIDEAELWAQAGAVPGARVVELGCGTGEVLAQLAGLVGEDGALVGVDSDANALAAARHVLAVADAKVELIEADALDCVELERFVGHVDVVVLRHVLIWNGGREAELLSVARRLLRPGGSVYVYDTDMTALRYVPAVLPHAELYPAYLRYLVSRGHDPQVGTKLGELLPAVGFELELYRGQTGILSRRPGARGPAWAAREAMRRAGVIDDDTIARWDQAFTDLDGPYAQQPRLFMTGFTALGRVPEQS